MADLISKDENKGVLYGSLIAAGINAARGRNIGDGLMKALGGGSKAYLGGINNLYEQKKQALEQERMQKTMQFQDSKMAHEQAMMPFEQQKMQQDVLSGQALMQDRQEALRQKKETDYQNDIVDNLSMQRSTLPMDYLKGAVPEQGGRTVEQILQGEMAGYKGGRQILAQQESERLKQAELARKEAADKSREEIAIARMEKSSRDAEARLQASMQNQNNAMLRPMISKTAGELPKLKTEAMTAKNVLPMYDRALDLIKTGVTGKGGAVKAFISPYAEAMGIDAQNIKDSEAFQIMTNVIAGPMRLELIGPGAVTEYEQKLKQQMSGGGGAGRQAATELINYYKTIANQKIGNYNTSLEGAVALHPDFGKLHRPIKYEAPKEATTQPKTQPVSGGNTRLKMPDGSIAEFDASGKRIR